ncbi:MAG: ATP-binding protein [Thermodesulfobacteriota bacterium]
MRDECPPEEASGGRRNEGILFSELGYKAILDLLPCYLSIQDPSFHILHTNQAFRNDFGEGIGRKCYEVYKKSPSRCPSCPVRRTLEDKKVHMSEETVHLNSGEVVQLIVYSAPVLDAMGNAVAAMELSINIGKVKEVQEDLALLGQSVAVLSHDIKNILEGLQGGAYVVDQAIKEQDQGLITKGWAVVKKNIYEITWLVQNILYFSKKRKPSYEAIALEGILIETVAAFREKAEQTNCHLGVRVNPALPMVSMDPGAVRRMLNNLVSNAIAACARDQGKASHSIALRADYLDRAHFVLEVEDDGIGMDDATSERLFKRFFSTKGVDGTGLGLMVVHEIVEGHGGKIQVLSAPGKGSLFRIILPLRKS